MDIDRQALLRLFLVEADEHFEVLESTLARLEEQPDDREALWETFRALHTLKGDAGTVGFTALAARAHLCEDLVEELHRGGRALDDALLDLLSAAVADLRERLAAEAGGETLAADDALGQRLEKAAAAVGSGATGPAAAAASAPIARAAPTSAPIDGPPPVDRLGVPLERLDALVELVSELAVSRHRVRRMLADGEPPARVLEMHEEADLGFERLQSLVLGLRALPIGRLFRRLRSTVRNAAAEEGKRARLALVGEGEEVDARLAEALREPLTHLLRNAVSHGIEAPAEREAAGKDPYGEVVLTARRRRGRLEVTVADDGAGIDVAAVAARAGGSLDEATDHRLLDWIAQPGFSTRDEAGAVAGRGVGMDVVRRRIEGLRGAVEVSTRRGAGMKVTLSLPASVALIEALEVGVGDETYLVPVDATERVVDLPSDSSDTGEAGILALEGELVPWVRLRRRLGCSSPRGERESVVLVRHGERRGGLVVDSLLGKGQHLVRPLSDPLRDVACSSGSSLLTDGRVALVLDIGSLVGALGPAGEAGAARAEQRKR